MLETRTDPDFILFLTYCRAAADARLRPLERFGRIAGYTALFERTL